MEVWSEAATSAMSLEIPAHIMGRFGITKGSGEGLPMKAAKAQKQQQGRQTHGDAKGVRHVPNLCICICICIYVYTHIYIYVYTYVYTCAFMQKSVYIYIHTHISYISIYIYL